MRKITLATLGLVSAFGFSQNINSKIQTYLNQNAPKYNLSAQDVSDWFVESDGISAPNEISNYYIKQRYQGIEIYNAVTNVWVKNDEVINMVNRFQANIASKINTSTPSLSAAQGLQKAFDRVNNQVTANLIDQKGNFEYTFSNGDLENDPIKAELMYVLKNNQLKLVWNYNFYTKDYNHFWDISIDAVSGEVVQLNDMVISCNFATKSHSENNHESRFTKDFFKSTALPANVQGGSYRVVPYNYFSPDEIARELISNPENALASPNGWHNTNNIGGTTASNIFTYLRGNNVWARALYNDPSTSLAGTYATHSTTSTANGYSPTSTSYVYDYAYPGKSVAANTYIDASTTNLFYMNNILHDVWYQYGFNEASGNFQKNNYSYGASSNDFVYACAQYNSTASTPLLNNSTFYPPADGTNGVMKMFLWKVTQKLLTVNSPTDIAGQYYASDNSFNPGHVNLPVAPAMIQTDLVLYDDGSPDVGQTDNADGCAAAVNAAAINGHIVVIRRSTSTDNGGNPCTFIQKVKNAQTAGAIAAIIVNNTADMPDQQIGMSGADGTINIPAISVTYNVGEPIINKLKAGQTVNAKIQKPEEYVNADGDFDNGVISHEYEHGVSTRLTGGRNNSSCLGNPQQMGEGWSDWAAMVMQIKSGDVSTIPKGLANFVLNQPPTGDGLRNFPYTTDMSINPLTYGALKGTITYGANAGTEFPVITHNDPVYGDAIEVHNSGEVWAAMLWDLTWAYINKYGFDNNIYTGTGGNNKVMQIVTDAMKLQPCGPSYIDARDAIIQADQIKTGGEDYCLIWEVFARRGLGQNAQEGDNSGNITNVDSFLTAVEDFTVPPAGPNCTFGVNYFDHEELFRVFPNPTNGMLNVRINGYSGKTNIDVIDINGRLVNTLRNVDFDTEKAIDLNHLQTGVYVVKVTGNNVNYTAKFIKE